MNLQFVLKELEERGLHLTLSGADLKLQGPRERMDPELIARIRASKPDLIAHLQSEAGFPLTELQRGYLVGRGELVEIGGVSSHIYHEIEGRWDLDRLETALREVVARHGMLRTRFTPDGRQVEQPTAEVSIERVPIHTPEDHQARRESWSHNVLPADRAPLIAVAAMLFPDNRMVLQVSTDGLIMDAISTYLFFRDWHRAYTGDPIPDQQASFADYIAALEKARTRPSYEKSRQYWLNRLDDIPPHPDLPLHTSPAAITRPRFTQHTIRLEAPQWTELKSRAATENVTPTTLLLAAYAETLTRWGAGPRFTLNTTFANRPPIHPKIADAIGNFSETMLVGIDFDRQATFGDRARALQTQLRRQLDNRHFSGIEVLRELARRRGTVRMPYTFNSALGSPHVDASTLDLFGRETFTCSQTPQVWLNAFAFEQHAQLIIQFDEVDTLFPPGMIKALVTGYHSLLTQLLGSWSPRTFDLLPEDQKQRRAAANDTATSFPETDLLDAFLTQDPTTTAIITSSGELTYGELRDRALRAAAWLRAHQVARDELVGLVMRRGPEQIVGILATVLAGAAYLPVDATLPRERQTYLLTDGRVRCLLTNVPYTGSLEVLDLTQPTARTQPTPDLTPGPADLTRAADLAHPTALTHPTAIAHPMALIDPRAASHPTARSHPTALSRPTAITHRTANIYDKRESLAVEIQEPAAPSETDPATPSEISPPTPSNTDPTPRGHTSPENPSETPPATPSKTGPTIPSGTGPTIPSKTGPASPSSTAPGEVGLVAKADPDDLAYVLYTSGTTGVPKGVMISRRSVANVVSDCNFRLKIQPEDRFFGISAFNFDLSAYDVFGALSAGAAIVLPDGDKANDPAHWLELGERFGVTVWNSVPAIVSLLHEQGLPATLRLIMMSGDRIPPTLPASLRATKPELEVVSLGGPTETTIWNIVHPIGLDEDGSDNIPYGRPNANNRAYILDADGRDAPDWVPGEICAAGVGLARGYWADDARTAERFVHDRVRGERLYHTGDLGRYLPSGEIDILGRTDFQIKVNGYRIEAGEVETRLLAIAAVRHAVVVRQETAQGARLAAHLVASGADKPADSTLRAALRAHLPEYMIPSEFRWHDTLPLTPNGKVDRARLIHTASSPRPSAAPPDSAHERDVAEIWSRILKLQTVDSTATLYELGGDSIAAARILTGVRKKFGVSITLDQLPEVDTIRKMATRLAGTP